MNEAWLLALSAFTMHAAEAKRAELTEEFAAMKVIEFERKFGRVEDRRVRNRG